MPISQQRYWHCYENSLKKDDFNDNQQLICKFQVGSLLNKPDVNRFTVDGSKLFQVFSDPHQRDADLDAHKACRWIGLDVPVLLAG